MKVKQFLALFLVVFDVQFIPCLICFVSQ